MAILPDSDLIKIWRGLMRWWSRVGQELPMPSKSDLRAAVDATDAWIDANAAAYNLALPVVARTALSAEQKSFLFCVVALMRFSPALLRQLIGEID